MFRVWSVVLHRWMENVPVDEALVYKEEGYVVLRMDLPFTTPPTILQTVHREEVRNEN